MSFANSNPLMQQPPELLSKILISGRRKRTKGGTRKRVQGVPVPSFEKEKYYVALLMQRIGQIVDKYENPNDTARADESGADVVAVCGGLRIGVQVTDLDTGAERGQARRAETRFARDAASRDSIYLEWGQNDTRKVVAAIEWSITRKARMSFAGFDKFWLLLCCGVPEWGATASTFVMTPWLDIAELNHVTLDKLAGSKYSRAFIHATLGAEEQALYQWERRGQWSKSTLPVPPEMHGPDFFQYRDDAELLSDREGWCKHELERVLKEYANKVQEMLSAREGRYILKAEYISVREADSGFVYGPFLYDILDYLLRNGVVRLAGPHSQEKNLIYRLVD
jgi:hypothetical protein